jgi:hypothetical protein
MSRSATALLLILGMTAAAPAQDRNPGDPVPLLLSGTGLPVPSLKYRLAQDRREMTPGNAATLYYRAYAILWENSGLFKDLKEMHWYEWAVMPLGDLPRDEVRRKVNDARHVIREIELAGRRRDCDWQLDGRDDGLALLLPEVQGYRVLATVLAVKARLAMAEGRFADAVETLQSGLTFARNIAQGPTLIHVLVGLACSQIMLRQVEDLIQHPDAPDLYWALTVLPHPYIDPRKAMLEEANWMEQMLPFVKRLDGAPMTLTEMQQATGSLRKMRADFGLREPSRADTLAQAAYIEAAQKEAKESLVKQGLKAEVVEAMPAFQAVSLFAYREYRDSREEVLKWIHVPEGRKHPAFVQAGKRHNRAAERLDRLFFAGLIRGLGGLGTPSYEKVFNAASRLDRHVAALRCVEALRTYAARHGRWPTKLDDVKDVPLPLDPLTGKPFDYKVRDENHAVVSTPQPNDETLRPDMTYTYHVVLRK